MRIYKKLIIPVAVVLLLLVVYFVVNNIQKNKTDNQETTSIQDNSIESIISFQSTDANKIKVKNVDEILEFTKSEDLWESTTFPDMKLISSRVNSIVINMASITPEKLIEEDAVDLGVYGLDNPIVITISTTDSKKHELYIGSKTPIGGSYYIKLPSDNKVYTLGSYTTERLIVTKNDVKDTTLFTFEAEDLFAATTEFSIKIKGADFLISTVDSDSQWNLSYPIISLGDYTAIGTAITALTAISVNEFIEEKPADLSIYGLDVPSYEFSLKVEGKDINIKLGNEKDTGIRYAIVNNSDEVITIDASTFAFLDKPIKEFIDPFAYIVNIDTATKIVIEIDGETHTMQIATNPDDKDLDKFTFDGKDASMKDENDKQPFRSLYQAVIGVVRANIELGVEPIGKPEISFTYTLNKAPYSMKIEFIPKAEGDFYYYLMRNGEYTGIIVEKGKFDETEGLRDMLKKMKEFLDKTE